MTTHRLLVEIETTDPRGQALAASIRRAADQPGVRVSSVTPPAECRCCGQMVAAASIRAEHPVGLGPACKLCNDVAAHVVERLALAQQRQREEVNRQLTRVVREVRSGRSDLPTFDQPDL